MDTASETVEELCAGLDPLWPLGLQIEGWTTYKSLSMPSDAMRA